MKSLSQFSVKLIFLMVLFVLTSAVCKAQQSLKKKFAIVNIVLEDTSLAHQLTIHFNMNEKGLNSFNSNLSNSYSRPVYTSKASLRVPLFSDITYGRIEIDCNSSRRPALDLSNNLFLFQYGDTVTLHLTSKEKGIWFTGKNELIYNCIYKINCSNEILTSSKALEYYKLRNYVGVLETRKMQYDSVLVVQSNILKGLKDKINPKAYKLLNLDIWSSINQQVIKYFSSYFWDKNPELSKIARQVFLKQFNNYKTPSVTTSALIQSYNYCDFLGVKEQIYASMNDTSRNQLTYKQIDQSINSHYPIGILRDKIKLFAFLTLDRRRQSDFTYFIDQAIKDAGDSQFKIGLQKFKATNSIGANAFPFSLADKNNNIHQLKDFKGKLIVMDFWFTGCQGCTKMASLLKNIIPLYKQRSDIVFLSISIDRNKDMWQKSLISEIYCSSDEINLLADNGQLSPMIKYYNVSSYPTLIIISKEGKIISTTPPDPRLNLKAFTKFIDQNL